MTGIRLSRGTLGATALPPLTSQAEADLAPPRARGLFTVIRASSVS